MRCIILYDWNDYLKIAYDILNNNSIDSLDETRFRVSISRAYYAVFHNARILCETRKELKKAYAQGGGEHEQVYNKLRQVNKGSKEFISKCHSIANNLKMLKCERQNADYVADTEITKRQAELHYQKSERSHRAIEELKNL